jgi:DNA-directed RNA polymerase specialized sigma24 family protein
MSAETPAGSITRWVQQLDDGHASEAQQQLWARYFDRLTTVARHHLSPTTRRVVDEEDVALSVLDSFFAAAGQGRYPDLRDRTGLWPLLARMAVCKTLKQRRTAEALKRGGGNVRGDSALGRRNEDASGLTFDEFAGTDPTPETIAELRELTDHLLARLENDSLRRVARRKLEGYSNAEIAHEMGVGLRTIERKLTRIRTRWSMHAPG